MNNVTKYHLCLANPFILNGVTWICVWLLYNLGWSHLCPPLSPELVFFILSTSLISIIIGIITYKRNLISFKPVDNPNAKPVFLWLIFLYILLLVEIVIVGTVPLIGYATGNVTIQYTEFGLPFIHVIIVNGLSAACIFSFYCYKSTPIKKKKRQFIIACILCLIPFVLIFNRGAIIANIIGILLLSIVTAKKPFKLLLKCIFSLIVLLFAFGLAGNIRFGKSGMDKFTQLAQPTKAFTESHIPNEFLWSYLYIVSPLANTQNTINHSNYGNYDTEDLQNIIIYEMVPQIISKRIAGEQEETNKANRARLVVSSFTVSSLYGRAYNYLGWQGLWLLFVFLLAFIAININLVPKRSKYYFPLIISVDIIVVLNLFDNMLTYMGLIPQVLIFICLYFASTLSFSHIRKKSHKNRIKLFDGNL